MTVDTESWLAWQTRLMGRIDSLAHGRADLDAATRRRAALVVVDDLAAMVAAAEEPEIVRLAQGVVDRGDEALLVTGESSERASSALVNAVAANWNELDEGYRPATCHGGLYALPAAMAEVQATAGSVGDLLRAVVVGYEVATAYARVLPPPRPFVLHPHATLAPLGAAAAVAALRGAGGPGVEQAVFAAATLAAVGPFSSATDGVLVRNGWAGHGAVSGFTAVSLAEAGIQADEQAPLAVLHDALGYPLNEAELSQQWDRWAVHDGYHKQYACCQYAHSSVEAALELARRELATVPTNQIAEVVVATHPLAMPLDDDRPSTALGGKFSVPHTVAAVLSRRSADSAVFAGALLEDPEIARLRELVRLEPYPGPLEPPFDRPAQVRVLLDNGDSVVAECRSAVGGPDRPLSDADVLAKADLLTRSRAPRFSELAAQLVGGSIPDSAPWGDTLEELWST